MNVNKERALRKDDDPNLPSYGRITRDDFKKIPRKKDLFEICAAAAAVLEVDSIRAGLDASFPGLSDVAPWIPSLVMGGEDDDGVTRKAIGGKILSRGCLLLHGHHLLNDLQPTDWGYPVLLADSHTF